MNHTSIFINIVMKKRRLLIPQKIAGPMDNRRHICRGMAHRPWTPNATANCGCSADAVDDDRLEVL
jgi:hypothetical protein